MAVPGGALFWYCDVLVSVSKSSGLIEMSKAKSILPVFIHSHHGTHSLMSHMGSQVVKLKISKWNELFMKSFCRNYDVDCHLFWECLVNDW